MNKNIPPAQAWIGIGLQPLVINYLQKLWCEEPCTTCVRCTQIHDRTYAHTFWIQPHTNRYSVEDIDNKIHKYTNAQNERGNHVFFIFEQAERLTSQAATRLLKIVEEPPEGYHFIFLLTHDSLLAPLRSRCIIHFHGSNACEQQWNLVIDKLINSTDKILLFQECERLAISEYDVPLFLESLLNRLMIKIKNQDIPAERLRKCADAIVVLSRRLPQAGNLKFFWRQLVLLMTLIR